MAAGTETEDSQAHPVTTVTVAQVLVQMLVDAGATHVFGGHGGTVIPLIEAVEAHPQLQVPPPSHNSRDTIVGDFNVF